LSRPRATQRLTRLVGTTSTADQIAGACATLNNSLDLDQSLLALRIGVGEPPATIPEIAVRLELPVSAIGRRLSASFVHLAELIKEPDEFPGLIWGVRSVLRDAGIREPRKLTKDESNAVFGGSTWSPTKTAQLDAWLANIGSELTALTMCDLDEREIRLISRRLRPSASA